MKLNLTSIDSFLNELAVNNIKQIYLSISIDTKGLEYYRQIDIVIQSLISDTIIEYKENVGSGNTFIESEINELDEKLKKRKAEIIAELEKQTINGDLLTLKEGWFSD